MVKVWSVDESNGKVLGLSETPHPLQIRLYVPLKDNRVIGVTFGDTSVDPIVTFRALPNQDYASAEIPFNGFLSEELTPILFANTIGDDPESGVSIDSKNVYLKLVKSSWLPSTPEGNLFCCDVPESLTGSYKIVDDVIILFIGFSFTGLCSVFSLNLDLGSWKNLLKLDYNQIGQFDQDGNLIVKDLESDKDFLFISQYLYQKAEVQPGKPLVERDLSDFQALENVIKSLD